MLFVESGMRVHSGLDYLFLPKVVQKLKRKMILGDLCVEVQGMVFVFVDVFLMVFYFTENNIF